MTLWKSTDFPKAVLSREGTVRFLVLFPVSVLFGARRIYGIANVWIYRRRNAWNREYVKTDASSHNSRVTYFFLLWTVRIVNKRIVVVDREIFCFFSNSTIYYCFRNCNTTRRSTVILSNRRRPTRSKIFNISFPAYGNYLKEYRSVKQHIR